MANNLIPKVGTKGRFVLKPPFDAAMIPNTLYTMTAERTFDEIDTFGTNIYTQFYQPFNIPEAQVATDRAAGAVIITLMADSARPLYVPSTYVQSYPDLNYKPYNQYIAVLSFGPLADDTLFEPTVQALKNTTSEFLGVEPEVHIAFMPLTDIITPEQHDNQEAARQAAISNRSTDYARLYEVQAQNAQLQQRVNILEKIVKDNGLLD
ncbi:hypothetical protein ST201phi2-1p245 [Pseudomonas phage 201phi2-1]|uniref:Uncharacterized protein n=1 Tax=Pseudomonas phage 201phi2-1 TaxID=198110 RepID=B3FJA7_BP201|nr:hypothetical protein ST201phi2-1p245 [Pseudomonas phage 201phi2-1]ABY63073.1 hypothetical protein 201phi2-1p245 [Pseudomonas phage 201phi2-1]